METYTKLSSGLTTSSVWAESDRTVRVWIGMLSLADRNGYIGMSALGLAHILRVTMADLDSAIELFAAPDKHSRTKEHDGRRVEVVEGGWMLLNHDKYRSARDEDARREYERDRKRELRAKARKAGTVPDMSPPVTVGRACLPKSAPQISSDQINSDPKESERRARARPAQVDRLPEAEQGFTDRRMRSLFIAEFEAVQRATPSMNGKNVGDFHAMVCRTASLQGLDPETQFVDLVRSWLGNPLTETELRAPYACLAQAWGGLAATGTRKTSEASTETVEGLRLAAGAALDRGDMEGMRRIGARITEIENAAEKGLRRGR